MVQIPDAASLLIHTHRHRPMIFRRTSPGEYSHTQSKQYSMSNLLTRPTSPPQQFMFTPILTTRPFDPPFESAKEGDNDNSGLQHKQRCANPTYTPISQCKTEDFTAEELLSPLSVPISLRLTPPTPGSSPRLNDGNVELAPTSYPGLSPAMAYQIISQSATHLGTPGTSLRLNDDHTGFAPMTQPALSPVMTFLETSSDMSHMGPSHDAQDSYAMSGDIQSYTDTPMTMGGPVFASPPPTSHYSFYRQCLEESNVRNEPPPPDEKDGPFKSFPPFNPFSIERKPLSYPTWCSNTDQADIGMARRAERKNAIIPLVRGFTSETKGTFRMDMGLSYLRGKRMRWIDTDEIVLRCSNSMYGKDIPYPRAPSIEDLMHSLKDPNAPPSMKMKSAATTHHLQFYGYGIGGRMPRQHLAGSFTPPGAPRLPGALPYLAPDGESYQLDEETLQPHRQDEKLRFPGDLYTPRWIRGENSAREGWCSLCRHGHWMQLKTSQYWYHVRFTHGVNSNTGHIYDPPLRLRLSEGSFSSIYGYCGECLEWISICTPRRKRSFCAWFKHAHNCHRVQCFVPMALNTLASGYTPSMYQKPQLMPEQWTHEDENELTDSTMSTSLISSPESQSTLSPPSFGQSFAGGRSIYDRSGRGGAATSISNQTHAALLRYSWPHSTITYGYGTTSHEAAVTMNAEAEASSMTNDAPMSGGHNTHRRSNSDGVLLG